MSWEPRTANLPFQPPRSTTSIGDLLFQLKHAQKIGDRRPTTQGSLLNKRINDFQKIFYTQDGIHGRDLFDLQADEHRSGLMEMAHSFLLQQGSMFWPADASHYNYKPDLVIDRDREEIQSTLAQIFYKKNLPRSKNSPNRESDTQPSQALVFEAEPSQEIEAIDTRNPSTQPEAASETNTATHIVMYGHEPGSSTASVRTSCSSPGRGFDRSWAASPSSVSSDATPEHVSVRQSGTPEPAMVESIEGISSSGFGSDSSPNVDVNHGSTLTCRTPSVAPEAEASSWMSWTIRWAGNFAMSLSIARDSNPPE
ncbi:unnamed protein product [Clonostachys chloroleuca]|uniref:Uncharacterized protein n=1 Tax=Clonostachys chloroleuca TaxID=1926264 RepID=A0AA35M2U8_9HYPO|nr:unnamed protein product [Clonostachys chloroleuca]